MGVEKWRRSEREWSDLLTYLAPARGNHACAFYLRMTRFRDLAGQGSLSSCPFWWYHHFLQIPRASWQLSLISYRSSIDKVWGSTSKMLPLPTFFYLCFVVTWEKAHWLQTHYIAKHDFELLSPSSATSGVLGGTMSSAFGAGAQPKVSCMLCKHSLSWAISQPLLYWQYKWLESQVLCVPWPIHSVLNRSSVRQLLTQIHYTGQKLKLRERKSLIQAQMAEDCREVPDPRGWL